VRSIGDEVTRFDRIEPDLNSNQPGDERDTTTPRAMVETLLKIFTQDVLSLGSRALLIDWMIARAPGSIGTQRPAEELAFGRQDRHRREWRGQRSGDHLAAGATAHHCRRVHERIDQELAGTDGSTRGYRRAHRAREVAVMCDARRGSPRPAG
jgi:hypothetical protein